MFQGVRAIRKKLRIPLATLAADAILPCMNPEQANKLHRIFCTVFGVIFMGIGSWLTFKVLVGYFTTPY